MSRLTVSQIEAAVEAMLFVSGEAVEIRRIAKALDITEKEAVNISNRLMDRVNTDKNGVHIARLNDSLQMRTNPACFPFVAALFETPVKKHLTPALLETLAIIAYSQPITKSKIEEIRGVNADHAVNKLIEYNLVCEKGREQTPGKPILFGTTEEFLRQFGFSRLDNMPGLPENT